MPVIAGEGLKNRIGLLRQLVVVLGRLCRWSDRTGGVRSLFQFRPEQSGVSPTISSVCSVRLRGTFRIAGSIHLFGVEQQPVRIDARKPPENLLQQIESRFVPSGENVGDSRRLDSEDLGHPAGG